MVTQRFDDDFPFDTSDPEPESLERERERESDRDPEADRERDARRRRKERVLHTRISEQLSEDIRRAAEDLRVPASNLVRNVLEEAFGAVERVSDEVGAFLEEALSDAEGARGDLRRLGRRFQALARRQRRRFSGFGGPAGDDLEPEDTESAAEAHAEPETTREPEPVRKAEAAPSFPDVIGWQPLLANSACTCAACARAIAAGDRAFAGATERGLSRTFLCASCMRARSAA